MRRLEQFLKYTYLLPSYEFIILIVNIIPAIQTLIIDNKYLFASLIGFKKSFLRL